MDPNTIKATVLSWQASVSKRDPLHLEREMVASSTAHAGSPRALSIAMRRWTGARLVLLGKRLQGPAPATRASQIARGQGTLTSRSAP